MLGNDPGNVSATSKTNTITKTNTKTNTKTKKREIFMYKGIVTLGCNRS